MMRLSLITALALVLTPLAISAQTASGAGLRAPTISTDISAAKKKAKKAKKKTEENLKAAPSAPSSSGKSTY